MTLREWLRVRLVGQRPTGTLADYDPENCDRTSRIIVDSVEGARCDSRTFTSYEELAADFDRLLRKMRDTIDP